MEVIRLLSSMLSVGNDCRTLCFLVPSFLTQKKESKQALRLKEIVVTHPHLCDLFVLRKKLVSFSYGKLGDLYLLHSLP